MRSLRNVLTVLLLVLLCALSVCLIVGVVELRQWIIKQGPTIEQALAHANGTTASAELILNDAAPIVHKTLLHADRAVGEAAAAMASVAQTSREIRGEQRNISDATMLVLGETAGTLKSVNEQVNVIGEQARYTLSSVESTSKSAKATIDDFDRNWVNNPFLNQTAQNVAGITGSWNDISADAYKVEHRYFFPEPYRGPHPVLHKIGRGAYTTLRLFAPFAQSAYWLSNIH